MRGQEPNDTAESRSNIQHRRSDFDRTRLLVTRDAHQTALGLENKVKTSAQRLGSHFAITRDRPVNERGMSFVHRLVVESIRREAPRPRVLNEEVTPSQ